MPTTRAAYFDEDEAAVLDPAILDSDVMQSPSSAHFRKDSFANSHGVLSPAESHAWDHHYTSLPVESAAAGAANPYHEENNGFVHPGPPMRHPSSYGHPPQHSPWTFEQVSDNCTPTTGAEFMPPPLAHFENAQYHRVDSVHFNHVHHPQQQTAFNGMHVETGFVAAPQVQTPMSPHSHQDWMGMAQQEMESRPLPKRMRPDSPPMMVDYARRDGIRKKNGRIEIPQGRNINTIDELIDKTTDDDLLKELKSQKRLLRNREAALASRQRKKKHTEDLEVKEKTYAQQVAILEKDVAELAMERQQREDERRMFVHRCQESQRLIETLQEQMMELKVQHNEETSNLRKKVNILTEQLEAGQSTAMSAAPSSTGYNDFNADMENLNMGPHDWESFIFANELQHDSPDDFTFDPRPEHLRQSPTLEKRPSSSTIVPSPTNKPGENASDQPIATSLLFMLLLCGAFVASKSGTSQSGEMPKMPAEVRAAAPTVLNNLLLGAGSSATQGMFQAECDPQPSGLASHSQASGSRLEQMHHHLTSPTKQQEVDQAFSLTTAQYASIANMNYPSYDERPTSNQPGASRRPRRSLGEALASMEQEFQHSSKADVYTRSLLWSQIPLDVVNQFKEMVADHNEIDARRNQRTSHDGMYGYKVEP
ncbi:hypothetical protein LTR08_003806 [Meristemomyces frigidus]|nr:hypothetical protein LTR08_003806 [Meristemomyces frigidus]